MVDKYIIENLFGLGFIGAFIGLAFSFVLYKWIIKLPEGDEKIIKIAESISIGANTFLKRQFISGAVFFSIIFAILLTFSLFNIINRFVPYALITGGLLAGLSGFIGMKVSSLASSRVVYAADDGLNSALRVVFSSSSLVGFVINGLGLLYITVWYLVLRYIFDADDNMVATSIVTFGIGIALMTMIMRVRGGVFKELTDITKSEVGLLEKDSRNPAIIASYIGDNVGETAGIRFDVFLLNTSAIIVTMALGFTAGYGSAGLLLPVVISSVGILCSLIGTLFVQSRINMDIKAILRSLKLGVYLSGVITAVAVLPLMLFISNDVSVIYGITTLNANVWGLFIAVVSGIVSGLFTVISYDKVKNKKNTDNKEHKLNETSTTVNMLSNIAKGIKSSTGHILVISLAAAISFFASGGYGDINEGFYGVGIAAVAMLATSAIIIASHTFSPITANAIGMADLANMSYDVCKRARILNEVGNITAVKGRSYAISSTVFVILAFIVVYINKTHDVFFGQLNLSVINPSVLLGLFMGIVLIFSFIALTISVVRSSAQRVLDDIKRQLKDIIGLTDSKSKKKKAPDYITCVNLCIDGAQKGMIIPVFLALLAPIVVGFVFGPEGIIGLLLGIILTGFVNSTIVQNAGDAWDTWNLSFSTLIILVASVAVVYTGIIAEFSIIEWIKGLL